MIKVNGKTFKKIPFHSGEYCKMFDPVVVMDGYFARLSIRRGNAANFFNLIEGQQIELILDVPRYFWEKENAYSFKEISDKIRYDSIEKFANFRPLFLDKSIFYRSSSPFDDAYGRAEAVLSCIEKYEIKTIINLADSKTDFLKLTSIMSDDKKKIIEGSKIFIIGNDSGLYSSEFEKSVLDAIKIIILAETPCLIHCRAGKRRSGFVCAILQSLYGMNAKEIMEDYMTSYKNNNGVTYHENPERYNFLKGDTIEKILTHINGSELNNLAATTRNYLYKIGLSAAELKLLENKIRQ